MGAHPNGIWFRCLVMTASVVTATALVGSGARAQARQLHHVQAGVLVLALPDHAGTDMVKAGLDEALVPYTLVNLSQSNRPTIDANFLSDIASPNLRHAKFQAVVLPGDAPAELSAAELSALADFEREFKVRQLDSYIYPSPNVGLNWPASPGYVGSFDGLTATAHGAIAGSDFGYLVGPVPFQDLDPSVGESYGALSVPLPDDTINQRTFTTWVSAPIPNDTATGVVIGVYNDQGREQMVVTVSMNDSQLAQQLLFPGILSWLTGGVHLGTERNYFSVHIDDVFLGDQRWVLDSNCTSGDDCPSNITAPDVLMTPEDVTQLLTWQTQQGMKLDLAYNGFGYDDALTEGDAFPLGPALLADKTNFRWINHTYSHEYLGCMQDFSVLPWVCVGGPMTPTWVPAAVITQQVSENLAFATQQGLTNFDPAALVNGEHSGLRRTPQEPSDNPNLAPMLDTIGVKWLGSDNSREPAQRSVGGALTVPRYPMNIFYNTGKRVEEVDEYNWIYTSKANGGSGICEIDATSSCITPLATETAFESYIVPLETRFALAHILSNSPKPHYAHQSNLAEERILYPVLDSILTAYRGYFTSSAPLANPTITQSGLELQRQVQWQSARAHVSASIRGKRLILHSNAGLLEHTSTPLTVPASTSGPALDAYATERTGWVDVRGFLGTSYVLPAAPVQTPPTTCSACDAQECPAEAGTCTTPECQAVYSCLVDSGCARSETPETCYCGSTPLSTCAGSGGSGACAQAIVAATGGTLTAQQTLAAINDPAQPVGAAFERALCDRDLCSSTCTAAPPPLVPGSNNTSLAALAALLLGLGSRASSRRSGWRQACSAGRLD
jgi:hypothetical protein